MKATYQEVSESIESKSRIIYSGLSKLDSALIRLDESEKYAFQHLVNSLKISDSYAISVWIKEVEQIRIFKNKMRIIRRSLIKFCEKNQL